MKNNVEKLVWRPYPLGPFSSVWDEASEYVYMCLTVRPVFHMMNIFMVVTGYGICHLPHHSATVSQLDSVASIVATELRYCIQ